MKIKGLLKFLPQVMLAKMVGGQVRAAKMAFKGQLGPAMKESVNSSVLVQSGKNLARLGSFVEKATRDV